MRGGRWAAVADAHLVVGGAGGGPAFLEHPRELRGCQLVLPLLDRERLLQRGQLGVAPLEEEAQIVDVIVPRRRGGRRRRRGGGGGGLAGGLLHHRAGLADHGCGAAAGRREEGAGKRCAKRSTSEFSSRPQSDLHAFAPAPPAPPPPPRFVWGSRRRAAALAVGPPGAPRGSSGRRRRWCDGRTIGGRRAARRRRPRARRCGALAALAAAAAAVCRGSGGAEVRIKPS